MPYPLNQVLAETIEKRFDPKYNVYAILEILKHPVKYANIYNVIYFGVGLLQDYEYYFCEEKTGDKPDAPDDNDEKTWLDLLEKDTEWLRSLVGSEMCIRDRIPSGSEPWTLRKRLARSLTIWLNILSEAIGPLISLKT